MKTLLHYVSKLNALRIGTTPNHDNIEVIGDAMKLLNDKSNFYLFIYPKKSRYRTNLNWNEYLNNLWAIIKPHISRLSNYSVFIQHLRLSDTQHLTLYKPDLFAYELASLEILTPDPQTIHHLLSITPKLKSNQNEKLIFLLSTHALPFLW